MHKKITMVDYGIGNLLSVSRAFEHCGAEVVFADNPIAIERAERLVLPGVGAFADGMAELRARNFVEPILEYTKTGRPFLGICLGMQMMLDASEEFGMHEGLGLLPGRVVPIPTTGTDGNPHKVPHIGWSGLLPPEDQIKRWDNTIFSNIKPGEAVYFVHSFMAVPSNEKARLANVDYDGHAICASIHHNNLYGCQFHPEKSGHIGLKIIQNFMLI